MVYNLAMQRLIHLYGAATTAAASGLQRGRTLCARYCNHGRSHYRSKQPETIAVRSADPRHLRVAATTAAANGLQR